MIPVSAVSIITAGNVLDIAILIPPWNKDEEFNTKRAKKSRPYKA
ncbi:MAG: hypothetical protein SP4CHLAM1_17620 [Chlamydiia bacterium]|nr:hypothetical protein [Chlamydiia bacterium]MCH9629939.1 hypothetical protein [Chlamydiia bacterium]